MPLKRFRLTLLLVLLALCAAARPAQAQWQKVAANLYQPVGFGAMCYADGYLWLASIDLFLSTDLGSTWTKRTFPDQGIQGLLQDLQFFDRQTGVAACASGTFLTHDGGITWKNILAGSPAAVCFGATSSIIASVGPDADNVSVTTDGGLTWVKRFVAKFPLDVHAARDGSILVFGGGEGDTAKGHLFASTDFGATWQSRGGAIDFDSFTFAIDSCDNDRVYLANEDVAIPTDQLSQIFLTNDGGKSWSTADAHTLQYFAGNLAIGYTALYAQTIKNGILRSSDRGLTWTSIGGPSNDFDTRFIAAVTDNVVIAGDVDGNVWRTMNGGGDSIFVQPGKVSLLPSALTFADSLHPCDAPLENVVLALIGCNAPSIDSVQIAGSDSLAFLLENPSRSDSIKLLFAPTHIGTNIATLQVKLSDGSTEIVPLTGYGVAPRSITFHTQDISNDTIGGSIYIPIIVDDSISLADLGFHLSYDTTTLQYVGSYRAGSAIDGTVASAAGNTSVAFPNLPGALKNDTIAFALFHIFPTHDSCVLVTIDSFTVTKSARTCLQSSSVLRSNVCAPLGCIATLLSNMERRRLVQFGAHPNPTNGSFSIISSETLGDCRLSICDALGKEQSSFDRTLTKNAAITLDLSHLPEGAYAVIVHSAGRLDNIHFVLIK